MKKRIKKKETTLFFDSFKHFKNNFCNLICMELPTLVDMNDVTKYLELKSVNYKSKFPDMRKLGLIDYNRPNDATFNLTEEGRAIYNIIESKIEYFNYDMNETRLDSIKPTDLFKKLNESEKKIITEQLIKLLISYYDTADCLRPYLSLIKIIEYYNITKLDYNMLCNILAQKKSNILLKKIDDNAFNLLDDEIKQELKRPISYLINGLETAGIIDEKGIVIYDRELVKEILFTLNEIYIQTEVNVEKHSGRSAEEQRKFRDQVLAAYEYKCAITGESIEIENSNNTKTYLLEAAHIIPYSDSGSFSVNNGIALSVQMHRMFDKKLFAFEYNENGELEVVVTNSNKVNDRTGILQTINHKVINLPDNDDLCPDPEAIAFRKEKYLLS